MLRAAVTITLFLLTTPLLAQPGGFTVDLRPAWPMLATKYDQDHDGVIHLEEYPRGVRPFRNLDRDGNGVLTVEDANPYATARRAAKHVDPVHVLSLALVRRQDADGDGSVTRAEWDAAVAGMDADGDGALSEEEIAAAMTDEEHAPPKMLSRWVKIEDRNHDQRLDHDELERVFSSLDIDGDGTLQPHERLDRDAAGERPKTPSRRPGPPPRLGEPPVDFELPGLGDEATITLSRVAPQHQPVALIFGSYTAPTFRHAARRLRALQSTYRDRVRFVIVYVREQHAIDSESPGAFGSIEDPIDDAERRALATRCVADLGLADFSVAVDGVDDWVADTYRARPVRMLLIGRDGNLAWASAATPLAFDVGDLEDAIRAALAPPHDAAGK